MTTILDALLNADYNARNSNSMSLMFAKEQLHNAATLLGKGWGLYDDIDELLGDYENVDMVPECDIIRETMKEVKDE